jgi:tetratricopeptide (TPR) repeat protein
MRRLAAALMGVALASTVGLAQSPNARDDSDRARAQEDLRLYHAALDAYAEGDAAKGVAVLADPAWTEDRLRRISEVIGGAADPRAPWTTRRYGAAVLVHADVARSTANVAAAMLHVDFAANLIRRGLREHGDALRLFAEHWFVAMSGWLRGLGALDAADRMLKTARDQLPDNAGILYVSGTLAELLATEYAAAQSSNDKGAMRGWSFPLNRVTNQRNSQLGTAAAWLRRAAALAPGEHLIRVHLGRVLALRQDDDEAQRLLNEVRSRSSDDAIAYLACVFVAGLHVRQGRLDAAAVAYRDAIARYSSGHAAYVGLSDVLQRTGKGDEARALRQTLVSARRETIREPLWSYLIEPSGLVDQRLGVLRAEVRR